MLKVYVPEENEPVSLLSFVPAPVSPVPPVTEIVGPLSGSGEALGRRSRRFIAIA